MEFYEIVWGAVVLFMVAAACSLSLRGPAGPEDGEGDE